MTPLRCVIRADASVTTGTGHVVRSRTLATQLKARGWDIVFAVRELPSGLEASLAELGRVLWIDAQVEIVEEPAWIGERVGDVNLCVTDSYAIGAEWQASSRRWARSLMVIDDLATAPQDADLILNQNLGVLESDYEDLVSADARTLIGPRYALVRPAFAAMRDALAPRSGRIDRVLIFMSGADIANITQRAAAACDQLGVPADVVVGPAYPYSSDFKRWASDKTLINVHHNISDMERLMASADVSIGAASSASWERCTLGLASILVTLAANQEAVESELVRLGAALSLGWHHQVTGEDLVGAIEGLRTNPDTVRLMSHAAADITDGRGVDRVVAEVQRLAVRSVGG